MSGFLHTELLDALKERVRKRIDNHRESMAKGVSPETYRELVGRDKECRDLLDVIDEVKKDNDGDEKDEDSTTGR